MGHFIQKLVHIGPTTWFGLVLLLGLCGGELAKKIRFLPGIFGYITVGFLIGPQVFNLVEPSILQQSRLFIDISLGLVLFSTGRNLDFSWLRHNRSLLGMSLAESGLTFVLLFTVLIFLKLPLLSAALASTIAMVTSPAVLIMVTSDLNSHGPITRRALMLTSLNNFYALLIFTLLLPFAKSNSWSFFQITWNFIYHLCGAVILAAVMFSITQQLAKLIGKTQEKQFILLTGITILTIGLTHKFHLSTMLTLFVLGVAARNFDLQHRLTAVNFEALARLFLIILFVLVGIYLRPQGISEIILIVAAFIIVRILAKFIGVGLFAKASRLTLRQTFATSLALMPLAGVALGMSFMVIDLNPQLGTLVVTIVSGALAIMNLIGPITAQWAFLLVGEAESVETDKRVLI
ncbi:MAG: cation:proton antiporter [Proteobacteria bacterium]|nr:cation:proton antiporter [Pseudomonadota bacterium]